MSVAGDVIIVACVESLLVLVCEVLLLLLFGEGVLFIGCWVISGGPSSLLVLMPVSILCLYCSFLFLLDGVAFFSTLINISRESL